MCNTFYIIKDWLELFSYLVTILGILGVATAIYFLFKNRLTPKNIQIEFKTSSTEIIDGYLEIQNYTDKEFTIISCSFLAKKKSFVIKSPQNPSQLYSPYIDVNNVYIGAHSIYTIKRISSDLPIKELKQAKLVIKTTQGDLIYKLSHRGRINFLE